MICTASPSSKSTGFQFCVARRPGQRPTRGSQDDSSSSAGVIFLKGLDFTQVRAVCADDCRRPGDGEGPSPASGSDRQAQSSAHPFLTNVTQDSRLCFSQPRCPPLQDAALMLALLHGPRHARWGSCDFFRPPLPRYHGADPAPVTFTFQNEWIWRTQSQL